VRALGEAGQDVGSELGSERDDEAVVGDGASGCFDASRVHVDRLHVGLSELDASAGRQAAEIDGDLLGSACAAEHPQERGWEVVDRVALDEHDPVTVLRACEVVRGDEAACAAAEYDNRLVGHRVPSARR